MNRIKFFIAIIIGCAALFSFSSCNRDESKNEDKEQSHSEIRTRALGSYSVQSGRVVFPTIDDYSQTVNYLTDATESELTAFRNSISIESAAKAMQSFSDATCCDIELTDAEMSNIEQQFSTKVKIDLNSDGDKEVRLKYDINPEFTNLNGEYQVGVTVVKQVGTKLISITKPNLINPNSVNESTTTDATNGLFVIETVLLSPLGCCPSSKRKDCEYEPKKKKFIMEYNIVDNTQFFEDPFDPRFTLVIPQIVVRADGKHEKRKCFIFCWWTCDKVNLKHDFSITFTHNWTSLGLSSPQNFTATATQNPQCNIRHEKIIPVTPFTTVIGFPPPLSVCVTDVHQKVTNLSNNKFCSFDCTM